MIIDIEALNNEMMGVIPMPILLKEAYYEYYCGIFDEYFKP